MHKSYSGLAICRISILKSLRQFCRLFRKRDFLKNLSLESFSHTFYCRFSVAILCIKFYCHCAKTIMKAWSYMWYLQAFTVNTVPVHAII